MTTEKSAIKLRTVFMGTSAFAEKILASLIGAEYNIISVYTQPDKKVGREQELQKSAVKITAERSSIPVYEPTRFDEETMAKLREQKPDLIVVAAYGKILPLSVLELPGFGAINVHASLLPKFRGASPIQNAILAGENETGITIMLMDQGVDTGDILSAKTLVIESNDTTQSLSEKLAMLGSELLLQTLPSWIERKISPQPQDGTRATLCQLIERADGKIFWSENAQAIYDRFRAFYPWPGIFTFWQKGVAPIRLKLVEITLLQADSSEERRAGEVFKVGEKVAIQTGKGVIVIEKLQLEGKVAMSISDFINGYPDFIGAILK